MPATELRFATPPVRAVELTFFFDRVPLKLTSLAPLVSQLRERFPYVIERFARMPWLTEDDPDAAPSFLGEEAERFPFPWLTFRDDNGHAISFQDDRLMLRWQFETGREYPGYESLRADLEREFGAFVTNAEALTSESVVVRRARAEYDNSIPDRAAWTVAQRSFSVEGDGAIQPLPGLQGANSGGLFHFSDEGAVTHVDFAAFSDEADGSLSLRATAEAQDPDASILPFELLDVAHRHLIECFATLTTRGQQESWGLQ